MGALALAALVPFAAPAPAGAKAPSDLYGVAPQFLPDRTEIRRMERGRVGTLRVQVSWAAAEPEPPAAPEPPADAEPPTAAGPSYDFSRIDPVVLHAARARIRVLPFVYSTPEWVANDLDGHGCAYWDCYFYPPRSSEARAAWSRFLAALVQRYGPEGELWDDHPRVEPVPIRAWQVWNEQNSATFNRPSPDVEAYAALLESSADAIRAQDPGAEVVLGGMFGTPGDIAAWDYLDLLYGVPSVAESFDGVALHPYSASLRGVKRQVKRFRRATGRAGDAGASLWVTEIGWASDGSPSPLNRGRKGQARRLRQAFDYLTRKRRKLHLRNITWYSWRDNTTGSAGLCRWCPYSGLFEERGLVAKPAWRAYVEFTGGR